MRELAHEPLGWRPTTLQVTVRRYRCVGCGHVWRQDTSRAAAPRMLVIGDLADSANARPDYSPDQRSNAASPLIAN